MKGKTVSLSDLKNKVVVLDFWSMWCSPCKESFPAMQHLVNKYKNDSDVVFLFIDTWQNDPPKKVLAEVTKYVQDNKYDFNVLFDEKAKVISDYRVQAIPQKIFIDKNGNIFFEDELTGITRSDEEMTRDIINIIEAAKKIPVDPNINKTKLPDPAFLHPKNKQ